MHSSVRPLWICFSMFALAMPGLATGSERTTPSQLFGDVVQPVPERELQLQRGQKGLDKTLLQLNESAAKAQMEDNVLESGITGSNSVDRGAFANASGIMFSVQNTGNHVVIQNSTLINVNMRP